MRRCPTLPGVVVKSTRNPLAWIAFDFLAHLPILLPLSIALHAFLDLEFAVSSAEIRWMEETFMRGGVGRSQVRFVAVVITFDPSRFIGNPPPVRIDTKTRKPRSSIPSPPFPKQHLRSTVSKGSRTKMNGARACALRRWRDGALEPKQTSVRGDAMQTTSENNTNAYL